MQASSGTQALRRSLPDTQSETPVQDLRELRQPLGMPGHLHRGVVEAAPEDPPRRPEQDRGTGTEAQKRTFTTTIVALIGAAATVLGPETFTAGPGGELLDAARRLCGPSSGERPALARGRIDGPVGRDQREQRFREVAGRTPSRPALDAGSSSQDAGIGVGPGAIGATSHHQPSADPSYKLAKRGTCKRLHHDVSELSRALEVEQLIYQNNFAASPPCDRRLIDVLELCTGDPMDDTIVEEYSIRKAPSTDDTMNFANNIRDCKALQNVRNYILKSKPRLIIAGLQGTYYSWSNIYTDRHRMGHETVQELQERDADILELIIWSGDCQLTRGDEFLLVCPPLSRLWNLPSIIKFIDRWPNTLFTATTSLGYFGMINRNGKPVKAPVKFIGSKRYIETIISHDQAQQRKQQDASHRHRPKFSLPGQLFRVIIEELRISLNEINHLVGTVEDKEHIDWHGKSYHVVNTVGAPSFIDISRVCSVTAMRLERMRMRRFS